MTLDKCLVKRRLWEFAIVASFVLLSFFANLGVVWMEFARRPGGFDAWEPWVLEGTSHLGLAIIIPLVMWFDRRFPIRVQTWRRSLPAHALFSVIVSLVHVTISQTKSCAFAAFAASTTSSSFASGRPYRMFSSTVP